ncbi:YidC/Oxa1 family insertase periplasmic-domain containing protein [bacterium]|nr:YidC/Oxa1 family insertase periplasmic-domain containing protein [bacterium]
MEKRIIVFLLLSFVIFQLTTLYIEKTSPKKPAAAGVAETTTSTLVRATPGAAQITAAPEQPAPAPTKAPEALPPVKTVPFKNKAYDIEISPRGAVPVRWDIIDPRFVVTPTADDGTTTQTGEPLHEALIDTHLARIPGGTMPFQLVLRERNTRNFHNEINQLVYASAPASGDGMTGCQFTAVSPQAGLGIKKTWLFRPDGFTGRFSVDLTNVTSTTLAYDNGVGGLGIVLGPGLGTPDSIQGTMARWAVVDVVLKGSENFLYERLSKPTDGQSFENKLTWGGLQSMYFLGILIPPDKTPFYGARTNLDSSLVPTVVDEKRLHLFPSVELYSEPFEVTPGQTRSFSYEFYFGPKDHKILRSVGHDLQRVLFHDSYGWFRPIVLALMYMLELFHKLTLSWGWAIILLTVFVRLVAFPLVHKGMKAQAVMMEQQKKLKPYMDKINEKYKNDPQKKQQEIMKLYKEHNMNPLGMFKGCLWMFIQIPIFFALYKLLYQDIDLRGAPFLWFSDLSQPDRLFSFGVNVPILGMWFNLLPVITAVTQMLASKFTQTTAPSDPQQAEMQKMMVWFMPIFILIITYSFPSGLMLYWLVSNIWQVLQQLWVNKHIHGAKKPVTPAHAGAKG